MTNLFNKRMDLLLQHGSVGAKLVNDSNLIEDKTFENDRNFRRGILYDWDMRALETVEFKLEKIKTYTTGGTEVEYVIRFRPNYNPESKFKYLHEKQDGKERFGFYIDVPDSSKRITEKWLITGKDDRVAFDRYNVLKCNWCFEWVNDNKYYNCVGCIRDVYRSTADHHDQLGGTSVDSDMAILMPTNSKVDTLALGTRLMISDSVSNPHTYEVVKIINFSPLGVTTCYLKQCLYNAHTDFYGNVYLSNDYEFCFESPIEDLPEAFGGQYHMICDCVLKQGTVNDQNGYISRTLKCDEKYLYVHGNAVEIEALSTSPSNVGCIWRVYIDDIEYALQDLVNYFEITSTDTLFTIKAINKIMVKYVVKVAIYDTNQHFLDSVELEVCL